MNTLLHRVDCESRVSVETVDQLIEALTDQTLDLDVTYVVEVLAETLSDGSVVRSVRIRPAERA